MLNRVAGVANVLSPVTGASLVTGISKLASGDDFLVQDRFIDADGTLLTAHTPDTGPAWVSGDTGVWSISGNRAHADGTLLTTIVVDAGENDVVIEVDVATTQSGATPILEFRYVDTINTYTLYRNGTGFCEIREHINTGEGGTVVATSGGAWFTDANSHHIRLEVLGHNVKVYTDGALTLDADVLFAFVTATKHGLGSNFADTFYDNYTIAANVDPDALSAGLGVDTFTDSDGTSLTAHAPELGGPWEVLLGSFEIISGQLHSLDSTVDAAAVLDTGVADVAMEIDWTPPAPGLGTRILSLRAVDNDNKWKVLRNGANNLQIAEKTAGGITIRATSAGTYTASARLRAECLGSSIIIYVDGVEAVRYESATAHQNGTKFGVSSTRSDFFWDNLTLDPL